MSGFSFVLVAMAGGLGQALGGLAMKHVSGCQRVMEGCKDFESSVEF